jgi:hypothetical protein
MLNERLFREIWDKIIGTDANKERLEDKAVYRISFEEEPGVRVTARAKFHDIVAVFKTLGPRSHAVVSERAEVLSGKLS